MPVDSFSRVSTRTLSRPQLIDRIAQGGRVVVLHAERGSGKTELLSQWLGAQTGSMCAWVALDEGAADPRSFWLRALQALTGARPHAFGQLAEDFVSGRVQPAEALSLVTTATMRDTTPLTLVIDDIHFASRESQDGLAALLHRSPQLRLLATTRSTTRFEVPLTAATLDVTVLGSEQLALTRAETAELAALLSYPLDDGELVTLRRATNGHVLATRLALSVMRDLSRDGMLRPEPGDVSRGLEAMLDDVVPTFDSPEAEQLALAASLVPELDESLAERLTRSTDTANQAGAGGAAWRLCEQFAALNYGRIALLHGRKTFRLHTLVRAVLKPRALRHFTREQLAEIRRAAFEALYELSDPIEILELLVEAEMDRAIFPHYVRNFSEISLRRSEELLSVVASLPRQRMANEGTIPVMIAIVLSETTVIPTPRIRELLDLGMPSITARLPQAQGAAGRLLLLARFGGLRALREYGEAAEAGEAFLARGEITSPSWRSGMHAAHVQVIITEVLAGRVVEALELADGLSDKIHPGRSAHLHSILAFIHARTGDLRAVKRDLGAVAAAPREWRGSHESIGWHLAAALRASSLGKHEEAFAALEPILARIDDFEMWPLIVWARGVTRLMADQSTRGLHEIDATLAGREQYPISDGWAEQLRTLRGEFLMASRDLIHARIALAHSGADPASHLARARLALLSSQPSDALAHIDLIDESQLLKGQRVQCQLLRAAAHARLGSRDLATSLATQALVALDRLDNRLPLSWIPRGDLAVIRSLVPEDIWRTPPGMPFVGEEVLLEELSKREALVLIELARGGSIDEIAGELHVSSNTIKTQTRSIYRKLKVSSRSEALERARQMGLL
ncbi:helix-turn-helix transcriptional regulator [Leucobacter sp. USHLN153]|uniref:helix-turn-helix transcriptional regulator n=1 Tax=Leucobacter sp. USHLN153 TaxID=3081268 RepID=UPI0030165330